jgi:addiction module RelE/StbE family toxin
MNITHSKTFKKHFQKLSAKIQKQFYKRVELILKNHKFPSLKDHSLKGNLVGKRAFSISGDYRIIYRFIDKETVKFINIGSHDQVY